MTVWQFEQSMWEKQKVFVIVRAPKGSKIQKEYEGPMMNGKDTVRDLRRMRIDPFVGDLEYEVLDGYRRPARPDVTMSELRKTYREVG